MQPVVVVVQPVVVAGQTGSSPLVLVRRGSYFLCYYQRLLK